MCYTFKYILVGILIYIRQSFVFLYEYRLVILKKFLILSYGCLSLFAAPMQRQGERRRARRRQSAPGRRNEYSFTTVLALKLPASNSNIKKNLLYN